MEFLSDKQPGLDLRAALKKKGRRAVLCAVSYVGKDGHEFLPLKKGDILVCDAEEQTVTAGSTYPEALEAYLRKGVTIYSCPGLHAKVVVGSRTAWIGSANASESSSNKIEASIRVSEKRIVKEAREFVLNLIEDNPFRIRQKEIDVLLALERRLNRSRGSSRLPAELPDYVKTLKIVNIEYGDPTNVELEMAEVTRKVARRESSKLGTKTRVEDVYLRGSYRLGKGDWVLFLDGEFVESPCKIVSIHKSKRSTLYWVAFPQVPDPIALREELEQSVNKQFSWSAKVSILKAPYANRVLDFFRS